MPIVSVRELERRRALAQVPPSSNAWAEPPQAANDQVQARPRRAPVSPPAEHLPPAKSANAGQYPTKPPLDELPDPLWPEGSLSAGRDYEQGKYRPPIAGRFQKGTSGNPSGRPKKSLGLKTVVREAMSKKVDLRDAKGKRRVAMIEALVHKLIELATKGNLRAIDALLKLYTLAVPDAVEIVSAIAEAQDMTAADEAGLALLRDIIRAEQRGEPGGEDEPC